MDMAEDEFEAANQRAAKAKAAFPVVVSVRYDGRV